MPPSSRLDEAPNFNMQISMRLSEDRGQRDDLLFEKELEDVCQDLLTFLCHAVSAR